MNTKRNNALFTFAVTATLVMGMLIPLAVGVGGTDVTGTAPSATRGFASVVILEPQGGSSVPIPSESVLMDQIDKTFTPGVIVVRLGQAVDFRNSETLLHNVHVLNLDTGKTVLNSALPIKGMVRAWTPEIAGAYAVLCDVHPEMEAYILVTDSPYYTVADEDGSFALEQIPAGDYTMRIWNAKDSKSSEQPVTITGAPAEIIGGPRR